MKIPDKNTISNIKITDQYGLTRHFPGEYQINKRDKLLFNFSTGLLEIKPNIKKVKNNPNS